MDVRIAHHGHCFDGAASAALFSRYVRERIDASATITFAGLTYEPAAPPPAKRLKDGAVNAILDFRYTSSPILTWYFDHHVSAFQEPGSREHFDSDATRQKFHDGTYGSCTKLIADVLRSRDGWEAPDLADLVHWADIVDSAGYANADVAASVDHPANAITAVIQEIGDDPFCAKLIPLLASQSLVQICDAPLVRDKLAPIRLRHEALLARMERCGEQRGDVAVFDLSEQPLESVNKFVAYKLFPTAQFAVVLSWTPRRAKISIGFNPWSKKPRVHSVAELCERYGGGGHPVVGAISLPAKELPRAKEIVTEVVAAL